MAFKNPWGKGSYHHDRWFTNDWIEKTSTNFKIPQPVDSTSDINSSNVLSVNAVASSTDLRYALNLLSKIKWASKYGTKALIPHYFGLGTTISLSETTLGSNTYSFLTVQTLSGDQRTDRMIDPTIYTDYSSSNPFTSGKVGIKIDDTIIILTDANKVHLLKAYLFNSNDDLETYNSPRFIDNVATYSLTTIHQTVVSIKNSLVTAGTFSKLSDNEYFILDIPIILWKLGWYHSAVCALNWIDQGISLQFSNYFCGTQFARSKKAVTETQNAFVDYVESDELFDLDNSTAKIKHDALINMCNSMAPQTSQPFGDFNNLPNDINDPTPDNFIGATTIGSAFGDLDDLGASLGMYRYSKYVKGTLHKTSSSQAELILSEVAFRFSDLFEFEGFQILGSWIDNVYEPTIPQKNIIDYDGLIQMKNENYRSFQDKTGRGIDFLIYTPPTIKTVGTGTGQLNVSNGTGIIIISL